MAETALAKRRRFALQAVEQHLQGRGATALSPERLRTLDSKAKEGWVLTGETGELFILLPANWPFVAPEICIGKKHPKFKSAHIGDDGKLCLAPPHSSYSQRDPITLLDALLGEADQLLSRDAEPDELVAEFQNYWAREMQPKRTCLSLLNPRGPSRKVACWHGEKQSVYGETKEDVLVFLKRRHNFKVAPEISEEPFLWLSRGLVPQEFPHRSRQMWELVRELSPEGIGLLPDVAGRPFSRMVFGFGTENGPAMGAVTVRRPDKFTKGFREDRMCKSVAISRFFGSLKVEGCLVQRVDHSWIHSRGGEAKHAELQGKSVAILGCGSLGSGVATLLAKSGVGNLVLVDVETLSWNNIGRHTLGATSVSRNKAEAMAEELQRQMPSINVRGIGKTWQDAQRNGALDFSRFDLVVSTTGDWPADSMLNFECRTGLEFPPLIITWFEAHALAGHALLVADNGGCFACGTDEFGNFGDRATEWPSGSGLHREPACGAHFQPYGPSQMASTQSLAATLGIDVLTGGAKHSELRSWVAGKTSVESFGGRLTERVTATGVGPDGGLFNKKWVASPNCQLC